MGVNFTEFGKELTSVAWRYCVTCWRGKLNISSVHSFSGQCLCGEHGDFSESLQCEYPRETDCAAAVRGLRAPCDGSCLVYLYPLLPASLRRYSSNSLALPRSDFPWRTLIN